MPEQCPVCEASVDPGVWRCPECGKPFDGETTDSNRSPLGGGA